MSNQPFLETPPVRNTPAPHDSAFYVHGAIWPWSYSGLRSIASFVTPAALVKHSLHTKPLLVVEWT